MIIIYDQELYHYGVKGMKWGIRRYQNKDGTLTSKGKKRYEETNGKPNNKNETEINKSRKILSKRNIAIGATVVGASLAAIGAMYVYKKTNPTMHVKYMKFGEIVDINNLSSKDIIVKKGTKFHRVSSKSVEDYAEEGKRIYASYLKSDARIYKEEMPKFIRRWGNQGIISDDGKTSYEHIMKMNKDIKAPSKKLMAEIYMKVTGNNEVDSGRYQRFMENLNNNDNPDTKKFFQYVKNLGYNAILDENDAGNFTKSPLILLNPRDDIETSKSHKIRKLESIMNVILM